MLVNVGGVAARIAMGMGFQKGDDILETLKDGSIFTEILHEHWRHQLLNYEIVSFWGSTDNVSILCPVLLWRSVRPRSCMSKPTSLYLLVYQSLSTCS